ncbi:MAG: LysR family transcriptional regulator, partial [Pseudomonadota bacterium]
MKLDPKHLAQLSVVVETGSFQSAADRLGLTQPALSRNMKLLETRLGAPLFRRDGRRSIPNSLSLRLAQNGLAIRLAEEQASVVADQTQSGVTGELRIGAPPIVAGRFLTNVLAPFMNAHPDCSVELRTGLVHELRSMLDRGQIDVILGPRSLTEQSGAFDFHLILDDRVGILCRAGHPLVARGSLTPTDLEAHAWLAHSRGSLLRQQTEAALIASGVQRLRIA